MLSETPLHSADIAATISLGKLNSHLSPTFILPRDPSCGEALEIGTESYSRLCFAVAEDP